MSRNSIIEDVKRRSQSIRRQATKKAGNNFILFPRAFVTWGFEFYAKEFGTIDKADLSPAENTIKHEPLECTKSNDSGYGMTAWPISIQPGLNLGKKVRSALFGTNAKDMGAKGRLV